MAGREGKRREKRGSVTRFLITEIEKTKTRAKKAVLVIVIKIGNMVYLQGKTARLPLAA